ncbi:helix-turn-helix domain-containing protein [Streptomyces umbrinus]|uniref:helix-turn-helix domain-containing protein n=1 Tax=Streptomyces umbrinus TaxID=67370 RepID=UPI0027D91DD1|nr:helix-turn-helix transcriptional regulator [Streptomyces umbrinus]
MHKELVRRIRKAMTDQKMKQAELARKAEISTGALSNLLNMKSVPEVSTLELLAGALNITGKLLQELLRLRERADARTRRLDAYLVAARRAADEHPYAGVVPGAVLPLASVYQPQQLHRLDDAEDHRDGTLVSANDAAWLSTDDVLSDGKTCIVLAGSGGGKSSLLRMHLATSTEHWLQGAGGDTVPVLVPAVALASQLSLAPALAAAVSANLAPFGLTEALPPEFFAAPPYPDVSWLVLIDGLDEIINLAARRRVLSTIASVRGGPQTELYRFAVATRPLPSEDLDVLGEGLLRYEMEPFSPDDLHQVICRWFHALGRSDADQEAVRLSAALGDAHLTDVARTPLMTAMLCQLHVKESGGSLPRTRGEIYHQFVSLLHAHQHAAGISGVEAQTCAALKRWGIDAVFRAEHTLNGLPKLISYLAAELYDGNTEPALDILTAHPDARPPERLSEYNTEVWRDFLAEALRRSGLLTLRGTELVFLHQSFLEYFAACHATRDQETLANTISTRLRLEVVKWPPERGPGIGDAPERGHMAWVPPPFQSSYLGFLIERAYKDPGMNRLLMRWATDALDGCEFIARQVHLRTRLPVGVADAAASTLDTLARDTLFEHHNRIRAVGSLVELGSQRAQDLLYDLGLGTSFNV